MTQLFAERATPRRSPAAPSTTISIHSVIPEAPTGAAPVGPHPSTKFQKRDFGLFRKTLNIGDMLAQQVRDCIRCAVAKAKPDYFRRCAAKYAQPVEVLVLGDEYAVALPRKLPDCGVGGTARSKVPDVQRVREDVVQDGQQLFRQLLVEEQAHHSGRRNALGPALAFSGVRQASPDIFGLQLREFFQELVLGRARR